MRLYCHYFPNSCRLGGSTNLFEKIGLSNWVRIMQKYMPVKRIYLNMVIAREYAVSFWSVRSISFA